MAEHVLEFDCECEDCSATGLYQGMGERNGAAIVCYHCDGTGKVHRKLTYRDFEGRKRKDGIRRIYQTNPGIGIGEGNGYVLEDFGGMPYEAWLEGCSFGPGMEDRKHTCPAWFYQSADYKKKPDWHECLDSLGGTFSQCPHFCNKSACWQRWDKEFT